MADQGRPPLVVDKSYRQGATRQELKNLCGRFTVLMTEALFGEILTSTPEKKTACFAKLPAGTDPVILVPSLSGLMRWEVEHKCSCSPVERHGLQDQLCFYPGLADGSFTPTELQQRFVAAWQEHDDELLDGFLGRVAIADRTFLATGGDRSSQAIDKALELAGQLATDGDLVRSAYRSFAPADFPPADIVGEEWALFRWCQVQLAAVAEFSARHGASLQQASRKRAGNERLDLDHTGVALLVGRIATRDKTMERRFLTLRPGGQIVS